MSHTPDPKDLKDLKKKTHAVADTVTDTVEAAGKSVQSTVHHIQDVAEGGLQKVADGARTIAWKVMGGLAEMSADMADKAEAIKKEINP